ncbi:unnamed protein product [Meganyctiphanes norvegica]|uniref:Uncharacterized protein n=1 Tax=Meganyctiphanes norvegica TaxID=48144 RepID=A0AAV2QX17_MEGNR
MGSEQHYSLRWNDYTVKIVTAFQSLRDEEDFVDVTVACDGHSYSAHKMVLSACSPYFRVLLRANPCQHPIVILKDVGHTEMERLLEFMYNGEVSIAQDQLAAFLKTAESLKIRGLAGNSDDMEQFQRADISYNYNSRCSIGGGGASGRSSPSVSYAPSQASKDDELTTDVPSGYHSRNPDSPPSKRRKRSSAPAASHSDANAASHSTECAVSESGVEVSGSSASDGCGIVGAPSSGPNNDSDDPRLECRELKTEPRDPIIDVYAEGSDLGSDGPQGQQQHQPGGDPLDTRSSVMYPLAMPGPSGTLGGQDTSQEPGAAPGRGAVCEALNLSLPRPAPLHPSLATTNGTLQQHPSPPARIPHHHHQHHHHHHEQQQHQHHQQQQHHQLHHHAAAVSIASSTPGDHSASANTESADSFEVKFHPAVAAAAAAASGLVYPDHVAMDLAPVSDKLIWMKTEALDGPGDDRVSAALLETSPEYKAKVYPCPECHKVFRHPMSLHHHRHVHKGTYTCHSCGKVFSRRWDLHRHLHRSKMGCRRPNHTSGAVAAAATAAATVTSASGTTVTVATAVPHRNEFTLDLNNSPSN